MGFDTGRGSAPRCETSQMVKAIRMFSKQVELHMYLLFPVSVPHRKRSQLQWNPTTPMRCTVSRELDVPGQFYV